MNYQEFLTNIHTHFSTCMGENASLKIQKIIKNNGTSYDGLIILRPDCNISPTIYLTPYYHRYLEGVCIEDIYDDIQKTYENHLPKENFDTSNFTDYEKVKKCVVMRLVNYNKNKELLSQIPHRKFLDFAIIFYCLLQADERNQANILIYRQHLNFWGIDEEELYLLAMKNTPSLLPFELKSMVSILKNLLIDESDFENAPYTMYVLSNIYRTNGASVILYDGLLKEIGDQFHKDFLLLPSSIHEVILIPIDQNVDFKDFSDMVKEVNETHVTDDEILSDHVYFYSRENEQLFLKV